MKKTILKVVATIAEKSIAKSNSTALCSNGRIKLFASEKIYKQLYLLRISYWSEVGFQSRLWRLLGQLLRNGRRSCEAVG